MWVRRVKLVRTCPAVNSRKFASEQMPMSDFRQHLYGTLLGSAIALLWLFPTSAQTISSPIHALVQREIVLSDLADADVVYLGETHDRIADHEAQLDIVKALHARDPDIAIGLEMFQRPFQAVLEHYIAGDINEAQLRHRSEYDERWGFDWELYAPILRFARDEGIPLLALNTPAEVTRKVAREGLDSLTADEKRYIPKRDSIQTDDSAYNAYIRAIFDRFHAEVGNHTANDDNDGFDRFFQAQVLWDETMADAIARALADEPERQVVVLVGQGHVLHNYGLPSRVARRIDEISDTFTQRTILLNADATEADTAAPPIADYLWDNGSP